MKHIKNKLKPPKAFEEWCLNQIPIYEWSNRKETIRSSERENGKVIKKQLRSNSRFDYRGEFYGFAIILVTKKRIEIQSYGYYLDIINGKEKLEVIMTNFEKFENDKHIKRTNRYGEYSEGLTPTYYGLNNSPYADIEFYPNNWAERIKTVSELKYLDFGDIDIGSSRFALSHWYRNRFKIEYLQKINSHRFADEMFEPYNRQIDMRVITQKWLLENKHLLRNNDKPFNQFEFERRIRLRNGKIEEGIHKYMNYHHINHIPKNIGIIRFQRWVIRNKIDMDLYFDYISMMKDIGIELTSERMIIPNDLKQAHDDAVELLNKANEERRNIKIEERAKALKKANAQIKGFAFILPTESKEIVEEGNALNHCVGTSRYIERHKTGEITLAFIREELNKPLYTCEIKDGRIIQIRGKSNKKAPDEVFNITEKWLKENKKHLSA